MEGTKIARHWREWRANWRKLNSGVRWRVALLIPIFGGLFYLLEQWLPFEDWTGGWIFLGFSLFASLSGLAITVAANPEVLNARARRRRDIQRWDRLIVAAISVVTVAHFGLATLDAAIYWWAPLPPWWALAGVALALPAAGVSIWAMCVNPHFEPMVRIQKDRDHRVIREGPYRWVRHPAYASAVVYYFATPLILGSGCSFLTAGVVSSLVVLRTALEDRFLTRRLDGYRDYARQVRHRLVPGLW